MTDMRQQKTLEFHCHVSDEIERFSSKKTSAVHVMTRSREGDLIAIPSLVITDASSSKNYEIRSQKYNHCKNKSLRVFPMSQSTGVDNNETHRKYNKRRLEIVTCAVCSNIDDQKGRITSGRCGKSPAKARL
jgi:hypothetical protein